MNNIIILIQKDYQIEDIIDVRKTQFGSGKTYILSTSNMKYIVKTNDRQDFAAIHNKVQKEMTHKGFTMSRIYPTVTNHLITSDNIVLYEFLSGTTFHNLTSIQIFNAIEYMKKFNLALKEVPFSNAEIECRNHWDKAKDLFFITNKFENEYLNDSNYNGKEQIKFATSELRNFVPVIEKLERQLIHADLGADNFLFDNERVVSVIDFTPEYENELYSLCQFIYWTVLWGSQDVTKETIDWYFIKYTGNEQSNDEFYALLLKAALYRFIAPFIDIAQNKRDFSKLDKRLDIINNIINLYFTKR